MAVGRGDVSVDTSKGWVAKLIELCSSTGHLSCESVRGAGFETVDGFKTRTPFEYDASVHADYGLRLRGTQKIVLVADVFNLFDTQRALDYDPNTETTFLALNPDLGQPSRFNLAQLQTPRQIRVGVRFDF